MNAPLLSLLLILLLGVCARANSDYFIDITTKEEGVEYQLNGQVKRWAEIETFVRKAILEYGAGDPVMIRVDERTSHQTVLQCLYGLRAAGLKLFHTSVKSRGDFEFGGAFADFTPDERTVRLAQAMMADTIPHLQLKGATFEEALAEIRKEWDQRHRGLPLPVGIREYFTSSDDSGLYRITLEMEDVPFVMALRYVAALSHRRLHCFDGLVALEGFDFIGEGWNSRDYWVSSKVFEGLHLKRDSRAEEVRGAFERLGVKFEPWMKIGLTLEGDRLVAIGTNENLEQIAGILLLLENGFRLVK